MQLCYAWKSGVPGYLLLMCAHAPLTYEENAGRAQFRATASRVSISHEQLFVLSHVVGKMCSLNKRSTDIYLGEVDCDADVILKVSVNVLLALYHRKTESPLG